MGRQENFSKSCAEWKLAVLNSGSKNGGRTDKQPIALARATSSFIGSFCSGETVSDFA